MINGLLVYHREDYEKNQWFAHEIMDCGRDHHLHIELVLTDELVLGMDEELFVTVKNKRMKRPSFVINRSRDSLIATHFERMGSRVFNSSFVTEICNHKGRTHQFVNANGIKSVKTWFVNRNYTPLEQLNHAFPLVLKAVNGHGGNEVFLLQNRDALTEKIENFPSDEYILQEVCGNPGTDIRVFVLGNQILAAVKRYSETSFKSNFSLGGQVEPYSLTEDEKQLVGKIIRFTRFDFVGIDFLLDKDGHFLFNEIEDVVGTRTLYQCYEMDVVHNFVSYIKSCLK
ncbi:ATP-grasp domain-containing protein [Bacillus andreraoultii]|uniref:ATP-grasp domain-containing protein n=1 Tax=Bacillus andreraoultii TaxID=1499685 RepID=UPI00067F6E4B|nr:hypothetical protein [Bacillus andreraoultii]